MTTTLAAVPIRPPARMIATSFARIAKKLSYSRVDELAATLARVIRRQALLDQASGQLSSAERKV
jgi:hypothetical protein